jgi:hypothetical protein
MPSDEKLARELRKLNERAERQERETEELKERLRKELREPPDGMATMRKAYAESDPEKVREERQAARKGGKQ